MKSIMTNGFDHKRKLSPVHVDPISESVHSPKRLKKETTPIHDCLETNTLSQEKESCVSLLDSFAAEEITVHLKSLCKPTNADDDECCQLCGINELEFKIPPIHCSTCGELFNMSYSWKSAVDKDGVPYNFCNSCLKKTRNSKTISCGKHSFSKEILQEGVKYVKQEELWVQCDKCDKWQHQICALFNPERDKDKDSKYICPKCRLNELKGTEDECVPAVNTPPGSKSLPKTKLSDHIENRLRKSLVLERNKRAKVSGKSPREVPGAKDLVVRVVSSVKNKLKVKKEYLDILPGESYPENLPYTSKLIVLFQKIDGVEVCILAMYVQEFGSECEKPNQRTIYISYLDSVKYFTPDIRTINGDSLRTFVYQEIMIGYLEYCKKRGFNTCYIWSCPPKKGDDDYILNCHPTTQHTPKPDHLRNWYKSMLKKAKEQDVIEGYTSFSNKFMGAKNKKITAARLPYFDGAYWSQFIEGELKSMENDNEADLREKVTDVFSESLARILNSAKDSAKKDAIVMHKLKKRMSTSKEDFFVVNLRIGDEIVDTEDGDGTIQNDFMKTRLLYLGFCQLNNYQFDTLRRAKHTTMMTLYHIHKAIHMKPTLDQKFCQNSSGSDNCNTKIESIDEQQKSLLKNKKILDVLTHANSCRATIDKPCSYPYCISVKSLFFHSRKCKIHVAGGCESCKKIWSLIKLHCQHCEETDCKFPRCKQMKTDRR